jgi:hypothetical protein
VYQGKHTSEENLLVITELVSQEVALTFASVARIIPSIWCQLKQNAFGKFFAFVCRIDELSKVVVSAVAAD